MEALLTRVQGKHYAPSEVYFAVQRLRNTRQIPVYMIYDAESGTYPIYAKIRLEVVGEKDIIVYLPRLQADGTVPPEFKDDRYHTRANVSYDSGRKLIELFLELLGQSP